MTYKVKQQYKGKSKWKKLLVLSKLKLIVKRLKKLGYETVDDYLNECRFCVYDDEHDDICTTVEEYKTEDINKID